MAAIIVGNDKKIVSCFPPGPALGRITEGAFLAIAKSFDIEKIEAPTQAMIKHKFDIIMGWAVTLRGDMQWGLARITDSFDEILAADRNGGRWEPPTDARQCWVPADGR